MSATKFHSLSAYSALVNFLILITRLVTTSYSPSHALLIGSTSKVDSQHFFRSKKYIEIDEPLRETESLAYLSPPPAAVHLIYQGSPVDLVALNRERFEQEHDHRRGSSESAMKRGQFIEGNLAPVPERLLAALPDDLNRKVLDTLALETAVAGQTTSELLASLTEDPDTASIERLSKSCLTVHASSTRPEQLNVTFHLYTRNNPHIPYIMRPQITRFEMIKSSPLDPSKPIKWITHGFHTNVDKSEWMVEAKNKVLNFEDSNVILTDWRRGASPALAFYPKAAANAHVVAKMIVKILRRLKLDINFSRVHLIGHSLGAHIMGFVGSAFTEEFLYQKQQSLMFGNNAQDSGVRQDIEFENQLIGRITACDPALPCFGPTSSAPAHNHPAIVLSATGQSHVKGNLSSSLDLMASTTLSSNSPESVDNDSAEPGDWTPSMWTHLRPDSAIVVEVMHSNPGVMGYADPLGDYDFYPNGFERQPGCGVSSNTMSADSQVLGDTIETDLQVTSSKRNARAIGSRLLKTPKGLLSKQKTRVRAQEVLPNDHLRFTNTLGKIIKPIRDFFKGYTCSHHRAVEYMVESMYYERVPQDRKLDRDFVCQMVGYRCSDYESFKRGFCFSCNSELDCRALTMSVSDQLMHSRIYPHGLSKSAGTEVSQSQIAASAQLGPHQQMINGTLMNFQNAKRAMPLLNSYHLKYQAPKRSGYFFDTKSSKDYCLNHYHLLVKYRWFRIRDGVTLDGFQLTGTLANIRQREPTVLHKHTHQIYTKLITDSSFLGQVEYLHLVSGKLRPSMIEYIEITYMSNLDPRIRALGSARLCRTDQGLNSSETYQISKALGIQESDKQRSGISLFVRCTGLMV